MRGTSFRTLLAQAAVHGLTIEHVDIKNAYVQADIDDVDIYVEPAPGYDSFDERGHSLVLKLQKALYGSKQAGHLWQQLLKSFLIDPKTCGFVQCPTDPCLYTKKLKNGNIIIIGTYVDDLCIAHNDPKAFNAFLETLRGRFPCTYIGKLSWFLGMSVEQLSDGSVKLDQANYINDTLKWYDPGCDDSKLRDHPCANYRSFTKLGFAKDDAERARMRDKKYMQLLGKLMWMNMTQPGLTYYTSVLARYMTDPSEDCIKAAEHLLYYAAKNSKRCLHYRKDYKIPRNKRDASESITRNYGFYACSDSSWGTAQPTYGYVVYLAGAPVCWASRKLKGATSVAE